MRVTSPRQGKALSTLLASLGLGLLLAASPASARTLDTAYGEVSVEGQPERVVTLFEGALDTALTAGVTPLAAIATRGGDDVARYLKARAEGIAIVGTARETNLEAVIAQRPDIILAPARLPEAQYRLLSKLAPTLVPDVTPFSEGAWKQEARFFAKALGREAPVEAAIEAVEARAATLREQTAGQQTASLARWMPQGALVMSPTLFAPGLLKASGFTVMGADSVPEGRPHSDPLSLENLSRLDGDWLFMATLDAEGETALEAAMDAPAFARLEVAKRGQVVPVDGQLWTSASGPLAADAILDDIETALP
ncbi:ABC transporter substrate-binding protein [Onishia taeanensis]